MNIESQHIAIAETLGAKWINTHKSTEDGDVQTDQLVLTFKKQYNRSLYEAHQVGNKFVGSDIPYYTEDLDAMQEVWNCLGWEEKNECIEILKEIVKDAYCEVYFATAAQRAEAFLKTLKLWTTTPESVARKERE